MDYIAITLLAIVATTCLVYLFANRLFGIHLRLKSLVLCAACALFLSLVLPRIVVSFAGLAGTLGFLAIFAVIFAYFVAYYDDPYNLQAASGAVASVASPETQALTTAESLAAASDEPGSPPDATYIVPVQDTGGQTAVEDREPPGENEQSYYAAVTIAPEDLPQLTESIPAPVADISAEPEPEPEPEPELTSLDMELELNLITNPEQTQDNEPNEESDAALTILPPVSAVETNLEPHPAPDVVIEDEADSALEAEAAALAPLTPDPFTGFAFAATEQPTGVEFLETTANQAAAAPVVASAPTDAVESAEATALTAESAEYAPPRGENVVTIPSQPVSDSLDDLLDFAFVLKDGGLSQQALDAFRRALRLYRRSEAAPLLAIEIVKLLKDKGAYDEAIAFLSESRNLPALMHNDTLDQEFVSTVAYLRIVKNTLLQNRIGFVPFNRIPAEVAQEIDAEFREWRNLA